MYLMFEAACPCFWPCINNQCNNGSVGTIPYGPLILYDNYCVPLSASTLLHVCVVNSVGCNVYKPTASDNR